MARNTRERVLKRLLTIKKETLTLEEFADQMGEIISDLVDEVEWYERLTDRLLSIENDPGRLHIIGK